MSAATGRPASQRLDIHSAHDPIAPAKHVQRDLIRSCADCGTSVVRVRRARGPLPLRCPTCTAARRPIVQLRAYLRSAGRLAEAQGLGEVRAATMLALAAVDAAEAAGRGDG